MNRDIKQPWLLYTKGVLFVLLGLVASVLLLVEHPSLRVALFLGVAVWAFCRSYYFAFYVIEHYVDDEYRYAGLFDFMKYAVGKKRGGDSRDQNVDDARDTE